jgi:hypothetical protein
LQHVLLRRLGVFSSRFLFRFQWQKKNRSKRKKGYPTRKRLPAILSLCAAESYVREAGKPMKAVELALLSTDCCRKIASLTMPALSNTF